MSRAPRIRLVRRRRVLRNALFDVFLDRLVDGRGERVSDYLSIVPLNRSRRGFTGVAVLPVVNKRFGLIRVYRHPQGGSAWEIPKGFIERGEPPERAALRELGEETGLEPRLDALVDLGYIAPVPGVVKAKVRLFAAKVEARRRQASAELGHGGLRYFTPAQFFRLAARGAIEEPCTLVAAYRYLAKRGRP